MNKELYWSLFESTGNIEFYIKYKNLKNAEKELILQNEKGL